MGSIVLYIIEWAFALLVLLAIYKAAFSGTTLHRFNRFYLLGATLLSALLPLVHVTIPDSDSLVNGLSIEGTEFAQELSGTLTFTDQYIPAPETGNETSAPKISLWAVALICTYAVYVLTLVIGWTRGIIRTRKFLRGKPRRRLSHIVWLVTHNEQYGPFSWMNYIVISDTESGFARRASLRHEYSHVRLMHSIDLIILLACTTVNPVCWLVLQEIKIVHEFEADDEVINRYGIQEQDYQRLLLIRTVGAEAYALASSFNLNIKKRIIMMNKTKTLKRRLMWLVLLIPMLGMTSVLFARSEKSLDIDPLGITIGLNNTDRTTVKGKVVDEKGKPVADAIVAESPSKTDAVSFSFLGYTDKNGEFTFSTPDGNDFFSIAKEGYQSVKIRFENIDSDVLITLKKTTPGQESALDKEHDVPAFMVKERNLMRIVALKGGKVHVRNGVVDKKVKPEKVKDLVKQFIANPQNDSKLPVIEEYEISGYKTVNTTVRHVISLEREPGVGIGFRDEVFGILVKSYLELRDEWCRNEFGKGYDECSQEQQGYAGGMYPLKILAPEMRYYYDVNLRIRRSAILAYVDKTDSRDGSMISQPEEDGELLGVIQALEKYLDDIMADGQSRIRSVNLILGANADEEFVSEVKKVLRERNILQVKSKADTPRQKGIQVISYAGSEESDIKIEVTPQTVKAGDVIQGTVIDAADGNPIYLANVYEMDSKDRIRAQAITDLYGSFAMRVVDPNDYLKVTYKGYMETRRPVSNGEILLNKAEEYVYNEIRIIIQGAGMGISGQTMKWRHEKNGDEECLQAGNPRRLQLDDIGDFLDGSDIGKEDIQQVTLLVWPEAEMGTVNEVQSIIRRKGLLNIRYEKPIVNAEEVLPVEIVPDSDADAIYGEPDDLPEFPGGPMALLEYMRTHIQYPTDAREQNIQGRVVVQFVVNKDGSISDPKVTKSVYPSLDEEAIRFVKTMPAWKPGSHEGNPVRVLYTLPINLRLN